MTDWIDRVIADGLSRANAEFDAERRLGTVLWSAKGFRCYALEEADGTVLTVRSARSEVRYELVGVPLGGLS